MEFGFAPLNNLLHENRLTLHICSALVHPFVAGGQIRLDWACRRFVCPDSGEKRKQASALQMVARKPRSFVFIYILASFPQF